jgi:UDP-sugar pyrophosphorylase
MNSLCVPRKAGEAAGAITRLVKQGGSASASGSEEGGEEITINVEYNQLDPLLKATPGFEGGDTDDPSTGFSPFPGNVNNLLVYLPSYAKAIGGEAQGVVEEFVNPK